MKSHIINVLDCELSCYPEDRFPEGERKEVIEIGLTTVNLRERSIVATYSLPIVPTMSKISAFCTELTGWTEAKLKRQGTTYERAMTLLSEKHGAKNRLLVTDSFGDPRVLREQCLLAGIDCPLGDAHLNISTVISLFSGDTRNLGLDEKLSLFGLTFEGQKHRGSIDSRNLARLLLAVLAEVKFALPVSTATAVGDELSS